MRFHKSHGLKRNQPKLLQEANTTRFSINRISKRQATFFGHVKRREKVHIKIMLVIEIAKIKLTGGHIEFMLIIEMAKIEINRRLYWIYPNYRDGQNRN